MIGYAFCGSFCTHQNSIYVLERLLSAGYEIQPIMSETAYQTDTKFGSATELCNKVSALCGREIIHTIVEAEPLGPKVKLDALVICPCTGNTLAKMANGITDTAVCMAAKAHLRSDRPLVIAMRYRQTCAISGLCFPENVFISFLCFKTTQTISHILWLQILKDYPKRWSGHFKVFSIKRFLKNKQKTKMGRGSPRLFFDIRCEQLIFL